MYTRKEYILNPSTIWVEKYYPGNYGAPGKKRAPKQKKTPEEMEHQNQINRANALQRLILANFREGDWYLTLTYKKELRPKMSQEAKMVLKAFLDSLRKTYKKLGIKFKWIAVTEIGSKGAVHHHLVLEDIVRDGISTKDLIMKLWPHGQKTFKPLYEDGNYQKLSDYLVKKETKEMVSGCRYSHSRNLTIPKAKRITIHARRWNEEPKPRKGYYIDKDSLVDGVNPFTGLPYQRYIEHRIRGGLRCRGT